MVSWSNGTTGLSQSGDYRIVTTTDEEENVVSLLMIIAADPFDTAAYTCNVTNVAGANMSSAFLTVHGEIARIVHVFPRHQLYYILIFFSCCHIVIPNVTSSQAVYITNEGDPVTFRCSATGVPSPSFEWFNQSTRITGNNSQITISTINSSLLASTLLYQLIQELTIIETNDYDSVGYYCAATNLAGSDNASVELIVQCKMLLRFSLNCGLMNIHSM